MVAGWNFSVAVGHASLWSLTKRHPERDALRMVARDAIGDRYRAAVAFKEGLDDIEAKPFTGILPVSM